MERSTYSKQSTCEQDNNSIKDRNTCTLPSPYTLDQQNRYCYKYSKQKSVNRQQNSVEFVFDKTLRPICFDLLYHKIFNTIYRILYKDDMNILYMNDMYKSNLSSIIQLNHDFYTQGKNSINIKGNTTNSFEIIDHYKNFTQKWNGYDLILYNDDENGFLDKNDLSYFYIYYNKAKKIKIHLDTYFLFICKKNKTNFKYIQNTKRYLEPIYYIQTEKYIISLMVFDMKIIETVCKYKIQNKYVLCDVFLLHANESQKRNKTNLSYDNFEPYFKKNNVNYRYGPTGYNYHVRINKKSKVIYKKRRNYNIDLNNYIFDYFEQYRHCISAEKFKNTSFEKHLVPGYSIEPNGSYKQKYIEGLRLDKLIGEKNIIRNISKKDKLDIKKAFKELIQNLMKTTYDGDWGLQNLIYEKKTKTLRMVDMEGLLPINKTLNKKHTVSILQNFLDKHLQFN